MWPVTSWEDGETEADPEPESFAEYAAREGGGDWNSDFSNWSSGARDLGFVVACAIGGFAFAVTLRPDASLLAGVILGLAVAAAWMLAPARRRDGD